MEVRQRRADRLECRHDLAGAGEQEEIARIGGAILQERGRRIAAGIDLHRVDDDTSVLDVGAENLLPCVDLRRRVVSITVPAVLRVEAVGQQDDDLFVGVSWVSRRDGEGGLRQ